MKYQITRQLGVATIMLFTGACSLNSQATEVTNKPDLLIAAQMRNEAELEATSMVLYGVRSAVKRYRTLSLDRLEGDLVGVHFSGDAGRHPIDEFMTERVLQTPSSYVSLGASLQRVANYGKTLSDGRSLKAVLITQGTSDPDVIAELQRVAAQVPPSVTVYFAGVAPQHRNAFSRVLHPIREQAMVVGQGSSSYQAVIDRVRSARR